MPYQEPEYLPWDGCRVPLTFIAGYLGAGKTTLINELLATADLPIAVLVNDIGEINLDARLIASRHGDTIELTDGCVCCSLSDGFGAAFDELRARPEPPAHVVVELSGVAEPARVLPWARSAGFKLDGVVTLVDADHFLERRADPLAGHYVTEQVAAADVVVLTKLDLVDTELADAVRRDIASIAPDAPVVDGESAVVASLLHLGGRRPGGVVDVPEATLFDHHEVERRPLPVPIERAELDAMLSDLPSSAVRAKGIAVDADGTPLLIQLVGRRCSITELPEAEAELPTDLVVIHLR
ncbi:MAG: GTP-binding protein [Acidimicrobiales bacterium]|nr:GTP-binding protein [Acidimicrobiales bacterium]